METIPDLNVHRLVELWRLKNVVFERGNPDVRGWGVFDANLVKTGTVSDLIVDFETLKINYFEATLSDAMPGGLLPRRVLLPISIADFREAEQEIHLPRFPASYLRMSQTFHGCPITPQYLAILHAHYLLNATPPYTGWFDSK
jgi:hypothetical protein